MERLHRYLEYTNLSPLLTYQAVDRMVEEAKAFNFIGLCLPPFWVKKAKRDLGDADIRMITVVGFPMGYQMTETKVAEIQKALDNGADELDVVMNLSAFKSGMPWVKIELAKCATIIHQYEALLNVIIETAYLSDDEIQQACKICTDAGSDFVKTSTGYAPQGATLHHVKLIRSVLPAQVGIKAAGGIKTYQQALAMVQAGADRIGASSAVDIIRRVSSGQ